MTKLRRKGFSLIELMIGMTISLIVVGALAAAFAKINEGVRNAARSTDLSNNVRGVFQIFQQDLYRANVGLADLNMYQAHVDNFLAPNEFFFYGISSVKYEAGFSNITLQWFEYDLVQDLDEFGFPTTPAHPTYVVIWPGNDDVAWPPTLPSNLQFLSRFNPDPAMAEVQAGDFFLIYKSDLLYADIGPLDISQSVDPGDASLNEEDSEVDPLGLENGAFVVQVGDVAAATPAEFSTCFQSALDVTLIGPVFGDDFSADPVDTNYTKPRDCFQPYLSGGEGDPGITGWVRPAPGTWLARKLGDASSYNRVNYRVVNDTLVRDVQAPFAQTMVMASNVERFDVELGLDVTRTDEAWDGFVSLLDTGHWILDQDDIAVGVFGAHIIGRHTQAVKVTLTMRSLFQDTSDVTAGGPTASASDTRKSRTMAQMFKLRNAHLPLNNK